MAGVRSLAGATVFSGIQPTGVWHIGNYLGAVRNWVGLQIHSADTAAMLFCVVDQHALTVPLRPPGVLQQHTRRALASMLACGLDPARVSMYTQSQLPQHTELAWLLACHLPVGSLLRQTQFKSKGLAQDTAGAGLLTYPVLMAADVLLFRSTVIPVGDDQLQHLELARDVARRVNRYLDQPVFPDPQPLLTSHARILSLRDGTAKMSKSAASAASRIDMDDSADAIARKIRGAKTDALLPHPTWDPQGRPEVANLLTIHSAFSDMTPEEVAAKHSSMSAFKQDLTDMLVTHVVPVGEEMQRLYNDPAHLHAVSRDGAQRAAGLADETMRSVRSAFGLAQVLYP